MKHFGKFPAGMYFHVHSLQLYFKHAIRLIPDVFNSYNNSKLDGGGCRPFIVWDWIRVYSFYLSLYFKFICIIVVFVAYLPSSPSLPLPPSNRNKKPICLQHQYRERCDFKYWPVTVKYMRSWTSIKSAHLALLLLTRSANQ